MRLRLSAQAPGSGHPRKALAGPAGTLEAARAATGHEPLSPRLSCAGGGEASPYFSMR
jgi:hypothetical protein